MPQYCIYCTYNPAKKRWKFREMSNFSYHSRLVRRLDRQFRTTPRAIVKLPEEFFWGMQNKKRGLVAQRFYLLQDLLGLPVIDHP